MTLFLKDEHRPENTLVRGGRVPTDEKWVKIQKIVPAHKKRIVGPDPAPRAKLGIQVP